MPIKKIDFNFKLVFLLLFLNSFKCFADIQPIIIDGDTIRIGEERIRFSGIDAPEINQTCISEGAEVFCGKISKSFLVDKISLEQVKCISEGKDQYNRTLAECFVNGESLSRYLVREGYAFAYRKYSEKFIKDEDYAKENKIGMWNMKFIFPWDYRKKN
jgi:endonuclease YncB( thermonuclease family)|tara:strand:- start:315 stop:791 length:477 start_codon:yes stop_codon:yes gene_type:complete